MKRKAKELQAARLAAAKGKPARSSMTGFGGNGRTNDTNISVEITPTEPVAPKQTRPSRFVPSNRQDTLYYQGRTKLECPH